MIGFRAGDLRSSLQRGYRTTESSDADYAASEYQAQATLVGQNSVAASTSDALDRMGNDNQTLRTWMPPAHSSDELATPLRAVGRTSSSVAACSTINFIPNGSGSNGDEGLYPHGLLGRVRRTASRLGHLGSDLADDGAAGNLLTQRQLWAGVHIELRCQVSMNKK